VVQFVTRRTAINRIAALAGGGAAYMWLGAGQAQQVEEVHQLKPGQFVWHPERAPDGPVAIIVSLPDQLVHVYRNGVRIGVATCSTGKPGHATPTGVFMILQKDKNHHSSTYDNAPMPNMNRITWSGVALHAGSLPGYPASHGCIRLPMKFSDLLFGVTHVGTPVIVAGAANTPFDVTHPGLVLTTDAEAEMLQAHATVKAKSNPWAAQVDDFAAPLAVIVSGAGRTATLLQDGEIVAQGKVTIRDPDLPIGSNVFVLTGTAETGMTWQGISHGTSADQIVAAGDMPVLQRITVEQSVIDAMRERLHPGMLFVTTDLPAHADTRSKQDLVILNAS
jgi:hypothetical protein